MAQEKEGYLKVPHPSNDGTWVEFHSISVRQLEVLKRYKELLKDYNATTKEKKRANDAFVED